MQHHRTRQRAAALALALMMTAAVAPVAHADEAPPETVATVTGLDPGAAPEGAVEAPAAEPADPGTARAAVAVTERADQVWEYFRPLNVARVGSGLEPTIQNGALRTLAATWARQQASAGTYATDPALESKLPAGWTTGRQAIYVTYAATPAAAAQQLGTQYGGRDWNDPAITDVGLALFESQFTTTQNRYTMVVIGVDYPHSRPQAGETTLYRFYRPSSGTHFYSTTISERNTVIRDGAYRYEGQVAYVLTPSVTAASTRALHRFHQPSSGTHFYTSTQSEHDRVLGFPQYRLDGVAGKVHVTAGSGLVPMYRFHRPASGTHFYTASAAEMEQVRAMPGYSYEGVAFYLRRAS